MGISSGTFKTFYFIVGIVAAIASLYVNILYVLLAVFALLLIHFTFVRFDISFLAFLFFVPLIPHSYWNNALLLAGSVFYFAVFVIKYMVIEGQKPNFKKCGASFLVFMLASVCGVLFSHDRSDSLRIFMFFVSSFLIFLTMLGFVKDKKTFQQVISVLFIGLILTSLYAVYQNIVGVEIDYALVDTTVNEGMPGRAYGTFGNPNNFAEYLVLLIPFCFSYAITRKHTLGKILWLAALVIPVVALVVTLSRSSWVAFAISVFVYLALWNWKTLPLVLVAGLVSLPFLPSYVVNRIFTIGNMEDSSNAVRIHIWRDSLSMMLDNWSTGIGMGPNSFHIVYPAYAKLYFSATHSHMLYLEMWVETGIVGAIAFLGILWRTLKKAFLRYRDTADQKLKYFLIAAVSSLLGISFVGLVEYIFFYPRVMFVYFIVLALALSLVFMHADEPQTSKPEALPEDGKFEAASDDATISETIPEETPAVEVDAAAGENLEWASVGSESTENGES